MGTRDAIEVFAKLNISCDELLKMKIKNVKKLAKKLQQGEKYKQIVKDIKYELEWHKPEAPLFTAKLEVSKDEEFLNEILDLIDRIEKKYFPKDDKHEKKYNICS